MKVKSYTKSELAGFYGISGPTFKKWLREQSNLDLPPNIRILTPKQVAHIFEEFGIPVS
jgi:hypothetical protein